MEMGLLIQPILDGEADMVVGSARVTDSQSGFRALTRKTIEKISLSSCGFEVETEMTIKALKHGLRLKEVPITYGKRRGSSSKLSSFRAGSKILYTILANVRYARCPLVVITC